MNAERRRGALEFQHDGSGGFERITEQGDDGRADADIQWILPPAPRQATIAASARSKSSNAVVAGRSDSRNIVR